MSDWQPAGEDWQPASPQPDAQGGIGANFKAGLVQGVTGTADWLASTLSNMETGGVSGFLMPEGTIEHALNKGLGATTGYNPENVPATTGSERIARMAGAGASSALIPGGEEIMLGNLIRNAAVGMAAGTGAGVAQEAAPERLKPLAGFVGALAAGFGAGGLNAAKTATKETIANAARPFAATISEDAAQRGAADIIRKNASNPETLQANVAQGADELVPGSKPTTFQQTGDLGIGNLERRVAKQSPDLFAARRADQNAARIQALDNLQSGANPNDVAGFFQSQFRDMDAQTANHVDQLTQNARAKAETIGGNQTPEAYGEQFRGALQTAENAARTRERGMWKAVDPNGDLTGNVGPTVMAAKDIAGNVGPTAKPMTGEEAAIFQAAAQMPSLAPVNDLIDLRSRVSAEMRHELFTNGQTQSYARLAQLRGAIQDNLANTISQQAANESALAARGVIPQQETILGRMQQWVNDFYQQREGGEAGARTATGGATSTGAFANGEGIPAAGGFGSAAGDQGLPGGTELTPTFDEAAAERLKAATQATKERAQIYGRGPIQQVLAKAGTQDVYKLAEARAPEKFFHPGANAYEGIQTLSKAIGEDKAIPLMADYAAYSLRKAAIRDDGTIDPAAFARWRQRHTDALRALPDDIRKQFADAASASRAASDAAALHSLAIKDAQQGAIANIMKAQNADEVTARVGQILGSKNALSEMGTVARAAAKDPFARDGLKQAVANYLSKRFISNTEVGTSGLTGIRSDQFQTFLKNNRPALAQVFSPEEIDSLNAIADDLQRSNRSVAGVRIPGESNTAQDIYALKKAGKFSPTMMRAIVDVFAGGAGTVIGGNPVVGLVAAIGAHAFQALREKGIQKIDDLVTDAVLNPDVARALLSKVPAKPDTGSALALRRALLRSVYGGATANWARSYQPNSKNKGPNP